MDKRIPLGIFLLVGFLFFFSNISSPLNHNLDLQCSQDLQCQYEPNKLVSHAEKVNYFREKIGLEPSHDATKLIKVLN